MARNIRIYNSSEDTGTRYTGGLNL